MKELIFVRHAKSDWGNETLKDIDRHLNERGYSDAYFMSEWFVKHQKSPQLIVTSTATRCISTALIFARSMDFNMKRFVATREIYEASVPDIVQVIGEQDDAESMMLFGHNPGFTNICNELAEEMFFDNVPTCGLVSLSFDVRRWSDIGAGKGKLNYYKFPKDFKNHQGND
jgi:Phosphohistidine phosphatase SixA